MPHGTFTEREMVMKMERLVKLRYWADVVFGFTCSAALVFMMAYLIWRAIYDAAR